MSRLLLIECKWISLRKLNFHVDHRHLMVFLWPSKMVLGRKHIHKLSDSSPVTTFHSNPTSFILFLDLTFLCSQKCRTWWIYEPKRIVEIISIKSQQHSIKYQWIDTNYWQWKATLQLCLRIILGTRRFTRVVKMLKSRKIFTWSSSLNASSDLRLEWTEKHVVGTSHLNSGLNHMVLVSSLSSSMWNDSSTKY